MECQVTQGKKINWIYDSICSNDTFSLYSFEAVCHYASSLKIAISLFLKVFMHT